MKIIGLYLPWVSDVWVESSIKQKLNLVDELIISIGPHHKHLFKLKDYKHNSFKNFLNNEKIKFVKSISTPSNTISQNICKTLNKMLETSDNNDVGNIIWLFETFDFYNQDSIAEIKDFIKNNSDFEEIQLITRIFCINLKYFVKAFPVKIFRIDSNNPEFISPYRFSDTVTKRYVLLRKNPIFDYRMLLGEKIEGIRWILEGKYSNFLWYKKIYSNYDPNNEIYWMEKNKELGGDRRFFYPTLNIVENYNNGLIKYDGKHPKIIDESSLDEIDDFREYHQKIQKSDLYFKIIRNIINDIKKTKSKKRLGNLSNHLWIFLKKIYIWIFPYINNKVEEKIKTMKQNPLIAKIFHNRH